MGSHNEGSDVIELVLQGGSAQAVIAAARAHPGSAALARACSAWGRLMETVQFELGLAEATALAQPPDDSAAAASDNADQESTTATEDEDEDCEGNDGKEQDVVVEAPAAAQI